MAHERTIGGGVTDATHPTPHIKILPNGPYRVTGAPLVRMRPIYNSEGDGVEWVRGVEVDHSDPVDLCRCGRSRNLPFCDGSEAEAAFDGTEVADRRPSADRRRNCAELGPVQLTDDRTLCAHAAFCQKTPTNVWQMARGYQDPETQQTIIEMVRRCPSGRLQYYIAPETTPEEEELRQEVGLVENGPLWVRGGIPVEGADGFEYEVRNRMTLCRCGQSDNKPYCDGSHWDSGFKDS
ncbi:MAG: CDGSH iron-sulfur domain-containing protein [Actinomycetota bacterium]